MMNTYTVSGWLSLLGFFLSTTHLASAQTTERPCPGYYECLECHPYPTVEPCASCPTPEPCPSPSTPDWHTTWYPTTESPGSTTYRPCLSSPKFSKHIYQSSLPSWPIAGTTVHLGIYANTSDNYPINYRLVTPFEFVTLTSSYDLIFTSNIEDGAYVGPNNVMAIEVVAEVAWELDRATSATILIVFPRSRKDFNENQL